MTDLSQATRPIMWNIAAAWLMYLLFVVALGVFAFGLHRRVQAWRAGREDGERLGDWWLRARLLLKELLFQTRVRGSKGPSIFHSLIFYSFIVLVAATAVVAFDYDFGTTLFTGWLYVALTVGADLGGLFILVGVGIALWRRLVSKPESLPTAGPDWIALALVGAMVLTGFLTEGLRIATLGDPWKWLSPVGALFALPFDGLDAPAGKGLHAGLWWSHTAIAMAWIALIPYSKFFHMVALPTNAFFQRLRPRGELRRVDIEEMMVADDFDEESFLIGIEKPTDFTWKHRLDFDACISCGRCEDVCPATQCGHPFSPKDFIARCHSQIEAGKTGEALVGSVFDDDFIWYCRTCTACMEVCPAFIDHVDTMMEVRRNEVMMQGRVPTEAARALKMLENLGNPFGPQADRTDWIEEMQVPVIGPGEEVDVLYWIGCCTTFDPSKREIASDLCALLHACGISFGVLGSDERCCGDPARVLGEERLFQDIAKAQVEQLKKRKFKVLLASCPHCYNVLANEYPQFGADFRVAHHSEFLHEMLWTGDLKPEIGAARKLVYHDPCFLGRYQGIYDAPREVIKAVPGAEVAEMADYKERALCCGGGGGHFWMDLKSTDRINNLRVRQADAAGADCIVTGCAYCKQMLEDSVKALDMDEKLEVTDLATLMLRSIPRQRQAIALPTTTKDAPDTAADAS